MAEQKPTLHHDNADLLMKGRELWWEEIPEGSDLVLSDFHGPLARFRAKETENGWQREIQLELPFCHTGKYGEVVRKKDVIVGIISSLVKPEDSRPITHIVFERSSAETPPVGILPDGKFVEYYYDGSIRGEKGNLIQLEPQTSAIITSSTPFIINSIPREIVVNASGIQLKDDDRGTEISFGYRYSNEASRSIVGLSFQKRESGR